MTDNLLICKHNDGLGHCDVFGGEYCVESPCQHEELVEYAPVVHGEWVDKPTGRYGKWQSWCSACGQHSGIGGIESNRHKPFCPNCGAKMDGERKGDDG